MKKIFISYRRADSLDITHRIYDSLRPIFGAENIFIDMDSLPAGIDFRAGIAQALKQCQVMLVVIGANWLHATDQTGRLRLNDPGDFVRQEIEGALTRGTIVILPVLVQGASMPGAQQLPPSMAQLAYQNALPVDSTHNFHHDVERVQRDIARFVPPNVPSQPPASVMLQAPSLPLTLAQRWFRSFLIGFISGIVNLAIQGVELLHIVSPSSDAAGILFISIIYIEPVIVGWITGIVVGQYQGVFVVGFFALSELILGLVLFRFLPIDFGYNAVFFLFYYIQYVMVAYIGCRLAMWLNPSHLSKRKPGR